MWLRGSTVRLVSLRAAPLAFMACSPAVVAGAGAVSSDVPALADVRPDASQTQDASAAEDVIDAVADVVAASDATSDGAAFTCSNTRRDGDESDTDCGGRWCAPCVAGRRCGREDDCRSGTCAQGVCAEVFRVDDISIGRAGVNYVDPEFIDVLGTRMAYTDAARTPGTLWVADLDPVSGALANPNGPDRRIDGDVVPIADAITNGVEWGASRDGQTLFYTRRDASQRRQVYRADLREGAAPVAITSGPAEHVHWLGTTQPASAEVYTFIARFESGRLPSLYATPASAPRFNIPLTGYYWPGNNGPRYIPGTRYFVYSRQISASSVELVRVDVISGAQVVVTQDNIPKYDVWGFVAPEFGGTIAYAALVSPTEIGVYRHAQAGDAPATRIGTITVPPGHPHRYITSVELLTAAAGELDRTYLAFRGSDVDNATTGDASMWVAALGSLPRTWTVRRVDEGATTGRAGYRIEPEWLLGRDEAFLYYNAYVPPAGAELRRCRTGVRRR
jgi:hypothetical protein